MKIYGEVEALIGDEWSASRPDCFIPGERGHRTCLIGGWVGPRTGLDVMKTSLPPPEIIEP